MKLLYTISLFLLLSAASVVTAQDFLPFASGSYAGVSGANFQPASIADSKLKFDLEIFGASAVFTNNYYSLDRKYLLKPDNMNNGEFTDYLQRNLNGDMKSMSLNGRVNFFNSMIALSPKASIAFSPSLRFAFNVDNVTQELAVLLDNGPDYQSLWDLQRTNIDFSLQGNVWFEYSLTYARVLYQNKEHFLKGGLNLKLEQGIASVYAFSKDLKYNFLNQDTVALYQTYMSYGMSENITTDLSNIKYDLNSSLSPGFDFGLVYEYRPNWMQYKYDLDGEENLWRNDQDKYLFKLGIAVTDIGHVNYKRNELSRDFVSGTTLIPINQIPLSSPDELNQFIDSTFEMQETDSRYKMNLPTSLSFQADVRLVKHVYLNFIPFFAFNKGNNDVSKSHYISSINLIPRFDTKYLGVSFPIQYNGLNKKTNLGVGLRLGPIWVGSNDILSNLLTKSNGSGTVTSKPKGIYGTSVSFALKFPIYYKAPKDKDHDKVSNKKDKCPDIPGVPTLQGCPDSDGDGVGDAEDLCKDIAGTKALNGCPDSDNDGVTDSIDLCPDARGKMELNGCPDADGDGIVDNRDECPNNAGPESLNGCPDQDGDLIPDKDDLCPTLSGTRENKGCPFIDTDGDGVKDSEDRCPGEAGPAVNHGCPYSDVDGDGIPDKEDECPTVIGTATFMGCPDTDGDGISDKNDVCPTIPGIAENKGCPEIKKEEQAILNKAFDNLEFETGKSVIKSNSTGSLNELAGLMKQHPEWKLRLAGHTDNVGKPESNLTLSKNRTLAVKKYLVAKGANENNIIAEWYGQTKPVADNSTPDGRQRNRRVEMTIVFE